MLKTAASSHNARKDVKCKKCSKVITQIQIEEGYWNCSIDKTDYHKDCLNENKYKFNIQVVANVNFFSIIKEYMISLGFDKKQKDKKAKYSLDFRLIGWKFIQSKIYMLD